VKVLRSAHPMLESRGRRGAETVALQAARAERGRVTVRVDRDVQFQRRVNRLKQRPPISGYMGPDVGGRNAAVVRAGQGWRFRPTPRFIVAASDRHGAVKISRRVSDTDECRSSCSAKHRKPGGARRGSRPSFPADRWRQRQESGRQRHRRHSEPQTPRICAARHENVDARQHSHRSCFANDSAHSESGRQQRR